MRNSARVRTILLTNDDGINAPGLKTLYNGVKDLGRVYVIAPATNQSASSHSFSLRKPIPVRQVRPHWFAVHGTPTDCVLISHHALLNKSIDLLISGINDGPNLGDDVLYSGTVAAAIEGTLLGFPSIAVSFEKPGVNVAPAIALVRQLAAAATAEAVAEENPAEREHPVSPDYRGQSDPARQAHLPGHGGQGESPERRDLLPD